MEIARPSPDRGACLVARLDYGYPRLTSPGWLEIDLTTRPPWEVLEHSPAAGGLILREADLLLGWARTRSFAGVWTRLAARARKDGVVLECRFPRRAAVLRHHLSALGPRLRFWETPADGGMPPLYQGLAGRDDELLLHLRYEWRTGLGEARGGAALWGVAFCLAAREPLPATEVARALGVTTGAARSYLTWMEDAALVRRAGGAFALRHPLLRTLFDTGALTTPNPPPLRAREAERPVAQPRWNPEEID